MDVNLFNFKHQSEHYDYEQTHTLRLPLSYARSSDHVSNIVLTPSPCSLSNNPLNLLCPQFQPILLHLHNSLRTGVSLMAFGMVKAGEMGGKVSKEKI